MKNIIIASLISATILTGCDAQFNKKSVKTNVTNSELDSFIKSAEKDTKIKEERNKEKSGKKSAVKNSGNKSNTVGKTSGKLNIATTNNGKIIKHQYYTLSYNEKHEQAEWVAYKLTSKSITGGIKRKDDFRPDPLVSTSSASLNDYRKSGYDRGHLAPAGSMKANKLAMSESFFMSNMSPQKPSFNRGIWKRLETKVRYWVATNDSVFVVTGPILDNPLGYIGRNKVSIPRAYYKTILGYKNGEAKGLAFIMPNEKSGKSLYSFKTSIDEVEKITGIDFYYNLDDATENRVEANNDVKKWFLKK
ncbi:MAG: DNA/RNA non-specific endonuclease [Ichthyobacteriaceae bacterium]|nr:DNA/RNA non-specific endonuclease [Ichthyobacteriaceae bacterium]